MIPICVHLRHLRMSVPLLALALGSAGCGSPPEDLGERIDRAAAAAANALIVRQSADGAWRSSTYGVFRDGLSLTPMVLKAVAFGPDVPGAAESRRRGAAFLADRVREDGSIDDGPTGMIYPVYTASASAIALTRIEAGGTAREAWVRELRGRQLTEDLGWDPGDPAYGGWGYAIEPPRKGRSGGAGVKPVDADLSSTLFAVGALRIAGAEEDDPAIRKALAFVERCQNFSGKGEPAEPGFDDGGFFFSPTDPVRNKAGEAGVDARGRARYHSYGSATADGLRALLRCGLAPGHPRVVAARGWLERHWSAATNPGTFEPIREVERDATYFYYGWSVAHAFRALGVASFERDGRRVEWAEELARELIRRQGPDGTWINRYTASKEDDPLVATSLAAGALGVCRMMLEAPGTTSSPRPSARATMWPAAPRRLGGLATTTRREERAHADASGFPGHDRGGPRRDPAGAGRGRRDDRPRRGPQAAGRGDDRLDRGLARLAHGRAVPGGVSPPG
jgi:squalene-hopene/tetraprenyl-beta-curcumene cyclase